MFLLVFVLAQVMRILLPLLLLVIPSVELHILFITALHCRDWLFWLFFRCILHRNFFLHDIHYLVHDVHYLVVCINILPNRILLHHVDIK